MAPRFSVRDAGGGKGRRKTLRESAERAGAFGARRKVERVSAADPSARRAVHVDARGGWRRLRLSKSRGASGGLKGERPDKNGSAAEDAGPEQHRKPGLGRNQRPLGLGRARVDCAENRRSQAETRGVQGRQRSPAAGKNASRLERENLEQACDGIRNPGGVDRYGRLPRRRDASELEGKLIEWAMN